jgi:translocation and assembly module TamB
MTDPSHPKQIPKNGNKSYNRLISSLLVLVLAVASAGYWLFNSPSALQWSFSAINRLGLGLQFEGIRGTLQDMHIDSIHFANDELQCTLHNFRIAWDPGRLFHKHLAIQQITAEALDIRKLSSTAESPPATLPENLTLPFALSIGTLKTGTIRIIPAENDGTESTVTGLAVSFDSTGHYHRLNNLDFHTDWGVINASAALDGNAPFDLSAQIALSEADPWGDSLATIAGSLKRMTIQINAKQPGIKRDLKLQVQPFAANPVTQFHAVLEKLNPAVFHADAPNASLSVAADLMQNETGQLEGKILVENLATTPLNNNGLPFSVISTQASIATEFLKLQDIHVQVAADGILSGNLIWHWQGQSASADLSVKKLNPQKIDSRLQAMQLSGRIDLQGDTQQQSARIDLKDKSADLTASVIRTSERITLQQFKLQRSKSQLTGQGTIDLGNEQSFKLSSNLANFNIADFIQAPASNLNAAIDLAGQLSPQISGTLKYAIHKSHMAKSPVTGEGDVAFSGLRQFQGKAALTVGANHLLAQGAIGESRTAFQLTVNAPALTQIGLGLAGDLQTHVLLNGSLKSPDFHVKMNSQQLHLPGKQQLSGLSINGHLRNDTLSFDAAIARYAAHEKATLQHLTVNIDGKTSDHTIRVKTQINDEITLQLKAAGAIEGKAPLQSRRWRGQLAELFSTGKIPVRLKESTALSISSESVSLGQAKFSISDGFLNLDQLQWTPKEWKAQGNFSGIAIYPGKQQALQQSTLHLGGHWDFVSSARLKGKLQIHREHGDWHLPGEMPQPVGLETMQLQVVADNETITGKAELVSQQLGNAKAHLTVPIKQSNSQWSIASEAPLQGEVAAHISNLKWLDAILGDNMAMNGQLQIHAHIKGTLNQPDFSGTASGKELSVLLLEHGVDLQQGNLAANFHQSNLNIDRLEFFTPHKLPPDHRLFKDLKLDGTSGSLTIMGNIGLVGNDSHLNFKINQLPISHQTDYWVVASGSGQIDMHNNDLSLQGNLLADAGLLMQPPEDRPELSEDIVFTNDASSTPEQKLSLLLDMNLNLGKKFFIRVSGLEGRLAGQLQIQSDKRNALRASGSITAQDTTFKAYGQDLTVKRGIVSFQGPLDDPALSILAVREGLQVEAGVEILGTVRHPQIKLVSTPNVPDAEKLSWVVLGRKPDGSGLDSTALLSAAGSILGGQSGRSLTDQISQTLGVDEITVKQAGVGSSLTGQIGVVGKRISSRLYLSYERSLATTTMGITKLTYNLTSKITVVTQAGEDSAADLFYTIQFD